MGFLRRLLGSGAPPPDAEPPRDEAADADLAAEERERERDLLREDARRLDDELLQRQLRYAERSWTPPPQGGARRADDAADGDAEGGRQTS